MEGREDTGWYHHDFTSGGSGSSSSGKRRLILGGGGGGGSPPGSVVRFDPRIRGGGGGYNTDSCSPGCSGYGSYELIRVVRHGASVGALTDFGGVGRGGQC